MNDSRSRDESLATIPFRPFQHLKTVDDQLRCLASIRRHLVEHVYAGYDRAAYGSTYPGELIFVATRTAGARQ
jgi:hypothetical protein